VDVRQMSLALGFVTDAVVSAIDIWNPR